MLWSLQWYLTLAIQYKVKSALPLGSSDKLNNLFIVQKQHYIPKTNEHFLSVNSDALEVLTEEENI